LHEFTVLLAWLEYSLTLNRQPAVGISHPYSAKYTCQNHQRRGLFFLSAIKALLTRQEEAYKAEDYGHVFSLDDQFHRTLFEFAGLAGVWSVMQSARAEIDRVRQLKTRLGIKRKKEVMAEHWAIVDAIEAKDGARADEALRQNIGAFDAELGYLSNHPQFLDTLDSFNELVAQQRKGRRSRKLF